MVGYLMVTWEENIADTALLWSAVWILGAVVVGLTPVRTESGEWRWAQEDSSWSGHRGGQCHFFGRNVYQFVRLVWAKEAIIGRNSWLYTKPIGGMTLTEDQNEETIYN